MPDDIETKLIDKRVVQRYVKKGRLDEKDYERYLKSLPDLADHAVPVESNLDSDDLDALDDDEGPAEAGPAPVPTSGEAPQGG